MSRNPFSCSSSELPAMPCQRIRDGINEFRRKDRRFVTETVCKQFHINHPHIRFALQVSWFHEPFWEDHNRTNDERLRPAIIQEVIQPVVIEEPFAGR
ncbi:hypothetical protein [Petrachloros mirabilis]